MLPPQVQVTGPLPPRVGVVHEPPALAVADTKVVFAGTLSTICMFCAVDGPLLVAVTV